MSKPGRLCILGGFDSGRDLLPDESVETLGMTMAKAKIDLVCVGNAGGLIYNIAQTIREHGGHVTCIATSSLHLNEQLLCIADEVLPANDLHECKMLLFQASDGLAVLPDSLGTLDVLMEYLTWMQRVYHSKPVYIVDSGDSSSLLLQMFLHMKRELFLPDNFESKYTLLNSLLDLLPEFKNISIN